MIQKNDEMNDDIKIEEDTSNIPSFKWIPRGLFSLVPKFCPPPTIEKIDKVLKEKKDLSIIRFEQPEVKTETGKLKHLEPIQRPAATYSNKQWV